MSAHTQGILVARDFKGSSDLERQDGAAITAGLGAADARRLAACWNACEFVPIEGIESYCEAIGLVISDVGKGHAALTAERDHLRVELTAARALLDDAQEAFDEFPDEDHEISDRIRDFLKGGAS